MDPFVAAAIREQIASGQTSILEWIARDHSVSTLDVLRLLPEEQQFIIADPPVKDILDDLSSWGDLMIIVQTGSIVAEVVSALPRPRVLGDTRLGGLLQAAQNGRQDGTLFH